MEADCGTVRLFHARGICLEPHVDRHFKPVTKTRAIWNKSAVEALDCVTEVEQMLPFALRGFDVDNGLELLTWHLWRHFPQRLAPVDLRRSRPG